MVTQLEQIAKTIRARIIHNSYKTHTPHLGSCLSCVDILTAIYFNILSIDSQNPKAANRDRFILSKGHAAPALFQILAMKGFYSETLLETYGKDGSIFAEHPPTPSNLAGIEAATGSLGHGLPIGLGMAISSKFQNNKFQVIVLLGDGESNEGTVWEAAMMASAQSVDNLTVIIDFNKWQATGESTDTLGSSDLLKAKWQAFGWNTTEVNGHNIAELVKAMSQKNNSSQPRAIIAHTVKGKGVSFMENDNNWHYRIPTKEEVDSSLIELGIEA